MVEERVFKRGGLSPQAQALEKQAKEYVTRMLTASGYCGIVPDRHIQTAAGHYLFAKACSQAAAAEAYRQHRAKEDRQFAEILAQSALTHSKLALHLAPTVVNEAIGEIEDGDIKYPFHAARRFGLSLAEQELAIRGKNGYKQPMTPELEKHLGETIHKEGLIPQKRRVA